MNPSPTFHGPGRGRSLPRVVGVMMLLLGSVMATVALAAPESTVTAVAPGSVLPAPQASFDLQAAVVTWSNSNVTTVSASPGTDGHTCAIENGNLFCWGWGGSGRVGDGAEVLRFEPVAVASGAEGVMQGQVTAVAAGSTHTCAISAGDAYCWGDGRYLGNGSDTNSSVPVKVALVGVSVSAIAAGNTHSCAVTTAGAAWCWGGNVEGQLGNSATTSANVVTPVQVTGLTSGVVDIGVGNSHSCALMSNGGVKCWGSGANGRLGRGSTDESLVPVDVALNHA